MPENDDRPDIESVTKMRPKQAKFTLLKILDPTMTDGEAVKRAGFSHSAAASVIKSSKIKGILGDELAERGITLDTVAETIERCLNARKFRTVFTKEYDEKGRPTKDIVTDRDVGPDHAMQLRAAQTLIVLAKKPPEDSEPKSLPAPKMSAEEAERLVGRGPTEVVDADFEVTDADTG